MLVATMFPAQATATGVQSPSRKLLQASREFEGLLLDMLVSPMEKTFSSLPGQKDVPGGIGLCPGSRRGAGNR